jgi:hypothetical protein
LGEGGAEKQVTEGVVRRQKWEKRGEASGGFVKSSLKMSKMANQFKVQKPGKNRAKDTSAEQFIKATEHKPRQKKTDLERHKRHCPQK